MSLSDLASIGSFISGIAVLISLIYLSLQIRQNTLAHRATAHQSRSTFLKDHLHLIADPAIAPIFIRGLAADKQMTEVEVTQFLAVMRNWCIGMSEMVWAHDHGVLDDETYQTSVKALKGMFARPGARAFWQTYKPTATPSFARLVEGVLSTAPMAGQVHNVEQWRSLIAREADADSVTPAPTT
jgi:hypothetical protein